MCWTRRRKLSWCVRRSQPLSSRRTRSAISVSACFSDEQTAFSSFPYLVWESALWWLWASIRLRLLETEVNRCEEAKGELNRHGSSKWEYDSSEMVKRGAVSNWAEIRWNQKCRCEQWSHKVRLADGSTPTDTATSKLQIDRPDLGGGAGRGLGKISLVVDLSAISRRKKRMSICDIANGSTISFGY